MLNGVTVERGYIKQAYSEHLVLINYISNSSNITNYACNKHFPTSSLELRFILITFDALDLRNLSYQGVNVAHDIHVHVEDCN